MTSTIDANGDDTDNVYNAVGWRIALIDANDNRTSFTYDANGNRDYLVDPVQLPTWMAASYTSLSISATW